MRVYVKGELEVDPATSRAENMLRAPLPEGWTYWFGEAVCPAGPCAKKRDEISAGPR